MDYRIKEEELFSCWYFIGRLIENVKVIPEIKLKAAVVYMDNLLLNAMGSGFYVKSRFKSSLNEASTDYLDSALDGNLECFSKIFLIKDGSVSFTDEGLDLLHSEDYMENRFAIKGGSFTRLDDLIDSELLF